MSILLRAVEIRLPRLHIHLDFVRLMDFFRFVRLLPRFRCDFLPALVVRCFQRRLDDLGLCRLDRFERRYSFARHGLQPLAQRVAVVGHKLRPVPRAADLHAQCLLCRQVGMVGLHHCDDGADRAALERVCRGCTKASGF